MPQLDPTWFASQLFWLFITFGFLYVILAKVVLPPLLSVTARRETTIADDITAAESLKQQAEAAKLDYEKALNEARQKAQDLIDDALSNQKDKAESANRELDTTIAAKLNEANTRITEEKNALLESLTPATEELTSLIVEKLTNRNPAKDKIGSVITQLFKANNNG